MVAKVCARSQGQPLPGVLSAAMMAMRSVMVLWLLGIPSGPHVLGARLTTPAGDRSSQGAALAWNGARAASPAPDRGRPPHRDEGIIGPSMRNGRGAQRKSL